jgi:hypothetical protein
MVDKLKNHSPHAIAPTSGYIIRDHGLQYSVSSKHRQTERYVNTLQNTLLDLQELLEPISSVEVRGNHRKTLSRLAAVSEHVAENAYEDYWGESTVYSPMKKDAVKKPTLEKQDSFSKYFVSVVRRDSIPRDVLSKVGETVNLSKKRGGSV